MKAFSVPVEVRVFGFDCPDRMTCEPAFGLTFKTVFDYHHAVKAEDRKAIASKYLEMFARHHITPYSPLYGTSSPTWTEKWTKGKAADSEPTFVWNDWDAAVEKALGEYAFNTFRVPVKGKGSGDPVTRRPRSQRKLNGVSETNALLAVPRAVATSLDDYSTDPAAMEAHRLKLAEAIERLAVAHETGSND